MEEKVEKLTAVTLDLSTALGKLEDLNSNPDYRCRDLRLAIMHVEDRELRLVKYLRQVESGVDLRG